MKLKIINFEKVSSTNDVAINLIKKKNKKIGFVFSKSQTQGRGTYGKKWISQKGNLFVSIFFQIKKQYPPFNEFTIINSILISNVIKKYCKNISLKYPNDIFVNKKKICGTLQEVVTSKKKKFLIVGIGINVVSSPDIKNKYQTTNILAESEKSPTINDVVNSLVSTYENFFKNLKFYNYSNFKKKADLIALN
jgi:BirA family biotin operon repressor/biotin-[acetyl-CoA-carboxylase] ligase